MENIKTLKVEATTLHQLNLLKYKFNLKTINELIVKLIAENAEAKEIK